MNYNAPEHFSNNFVLDLNRKPARSTDRASLRFLLPGIVFGALLLFIGAYELLNGFRHASTSFDDLIGPGDLEAYQPLINPVFFDVVFILVGLGILSAAILSYLRFKRISFDGKNLNVIYRNSFGERTAFQENIKNYSGVRFRIELVQLGFINKNRYIIELYHKDPAKIVPLYISLKDKNTRRIWESYARNFNLPALVNTDEGLVSRDVKNLNKPLREMIDLGYVIDNYDSYERLPDNIAFARKKDKIVLKVRKIIWDAYNIMAWIVIITGAAAAIMAVLNFDHIKPHLTNPAFYAVEITALLIIVAAIFVLFRKEKLVLKKNKLVHTHKYMLFSAKHDEIAKDSIEAIDVTENPVTGRYFVSIISDDKTITFGRKLPIEDLRWVKKFLIHMLGR